MHAVHVLHAMAAIPQTVGDYAVLPLRFPPLPSYPRESTHYLYLRPHEPKLPDPHSPRSLFVANIPIDSTELHFRSLFANQQLGGVRVESVDFEASKPTRKATQTNLKGRKRKRADAETDDLDILQSKLPLTWDRETHPSGSSAVVVFVDRASMSTAHKAVRKAVKNGTVLTWGEGIEEKLPKLGYQRYLTHHTLSFPPRQVLQERVDQYMQAFAEQESARAQRLTRQRQVPDADGFVTVTRGARIGPARLDEARERLEKQKQKTEDKSAGMGDFYRFQVREKKKERAGELVRKFEEDRKRVADMRTAKRGQFKPM